MRDARSDGRKSPGTRRTSAFGVVLVVATASLPLAPEAAVEKA